MTAGAPRAVVIIDPAFLGDAVFDAALAREVKARWPKARVGLVLRPPADRLADFMPFVDEVHRYDKRGADRGLAGLSRLARELEARQYDLALVPHPSIRSTWLAARARIPRRVGAQQGWLARRPLTEVRPVARGFVGARFALLDGPAGRDDLRGALRAPRRGEPSKVRRIGLVLGSEWATKRWPIDNAAAWIAGLDPERDTVVLLGAPKERPLYEALRGKLGSTLVRLEDTVGAPIEDLVPRIASCDLLVAGDTGPLHIARGLGVPVVALFGPTDPALHVPGPADRVLTVSLECRPCSAHGADRCPKGHHRCLVDLGADRVGAACQAILEAGG